MSVTVKDLIEKVSEQDVSLWDMQQFSLIIRDANGKTLSVEDVKVNADNKTIRIKVK